MNRRSLLALSVASALTFALPAVASPRTVEGVRFDPTIEIHGSRLQLNGAGLRQRFMVGVYAAGLYLPERTTDPEQIVKLRGAKRVSLRFLRDIDAEYFLSALHGGLKANHSPEQLMGWQRQLDSLSATIRTIAVARRGDTVTIDFNPAEGIRVTVNGATRGPVIVGEDFYSAVLRIWIGGRPADEELKRGILGG